MKVANTRILALQMEICFSTSTSALLVVHMCPIYTEVPWMTAGMDAM
jgi:hypothetical protein